MKNKKPALPKITKPDAEQRMNKKQLAHEESRLQALFIRAGFTDKKGRLSPFGQWGVNVNERKEPQLFFKWGWILSDFTKTELAEFDVLLSKSPCPLAKKWRQWVKENLENGENLYRWLRRSNWVALINDPGGRIDITAPDEDEDRLLLQKIFNCDPDSIGDNIKTLLEPLYRQGKENRRSLAAAFGTAIPTAEECEIINLEFPVEPLTQQGVERIADRFHCDKKSGKLAVAISGMKITCGRKTGTETTKRNKKTHKETFCKMYLEEKETAEKSLRKNETIKKDQLIASAMTRFKTQNGKISERTAWSYIQDLK